MSEARDEAFVEGYAAGRRSGLAQGRAELEEGRRFYRLAIGILGACAWAAGLAAGALLW